MVNSVGKRRFRKIISFVAIASLVVGIIVLLNYYGMGQLRAKVEAVGVGWAMLGLFLLRFSSVVIPALPGTAYSILAGGLLGFWPGLAVVCVSDFLSCSLSFWLSSRYGRSLVKRVTGDRFITRVDQLAEKHLERNFFLLTAFLMTGLFDFVAYGVGLTKAPWRRFLPALLLSVALSNPPIVALGSGLFEGGKLPWGLALPGMFGLALVTGLVQRRMSA